MKKDNRKKGEYSNSILESFVTRSKATQDITDCRMQLAAKIYEGAKAKGWNKSMFAEAMGKQNSIISKWLSGTHNFETDTLFEIQQKLSINLIDLGKVKSNQVTKSARKTPAKKSEKNKK